MTVFGNIWVGLLVFVSYFMFRMISESVTQYDYIVTGFVSLFLLVALFALFATVTAQGKLAFLGWPRPLQFVGVAIACLSLTVLIGLSAALHGSGGQEFPWAIKPFCPWAAFLGPLGLAVIGGLWLNSKWLDIPEAVPRFAFGLATVISLASNVTLVVEIRHNHQVQAAEKIRDDLIIVQQTDPENDFIHLLLYANETDSPPSRQLALQKIRATGPRFNALIIDCLKKPGFHEALTYLRDNDPPGDAAPLAEPARDAIVLLAGRLRDELATGRPLEAGDIESQVATVLTVADKYAKYGPDFLPAVRDYRAALEAPKSMKVPRASVTKMDTWLAAKGKYGEPLL